MTNFKDVITDYELYVILDAVFNRRYEAKMNVEKIEDGKKDISEYEYWKKIYNDCDKVYVKLINMIM